MFGKEIPNLDPKKKNSGLLTEFFYKEVFPRKKETFYSSQTGVCVLIFFCGRKENFLGVPREAFFLAQFL